MAEILLNFFDNIILAAAVEEVVPAVGFFKDRYFPTGAGDIFKADKVITSCLSRSFTASPLRRMPATTATATANWRRSLLPALATFP